MSCTRLWNGLQKPAGICAPFRMLAETMCGSSRHISLRSLGLSRIFCPPKSALDRPTGDPPVTTTADPQIVPHQPAAAPALLAADQGVASALESVLSDNTR